MLSRLVVIALVSASLAACGMDARRDVGARATISNTSPADSAEIDSMIAAGEAAYFRSEYDTAQALLERGEAMAVSGGDSSLRARALTWLGLTAWRQGRYADARALGDQALDLKKKQNLRHELFRSHNALGLLAHSEGRFGDARGHFNSARIAAEDVADSVSAAKATGNLGLVFADIGEFDSARTAFESMRVSANSAGDSRAEANALNNLGMVGIRSGDPNTALEALAQARALYRRVNYPAGEEASLGQMGSAHDALGDPERALAFMDSALAVAREHDLKQPEAEDLQIIGELLGDAGDHQRAVEYLANANKIARGLGLGSRIGDIARAEAREYAAMAHTDAALTRSREAAEAHRSAGAMIEELNDQLLYAEIAARSGRMKDARGALSIAATIARRRESPAANDALRLGRARVADASFDYQAVLTELDRGGDPVENLGAAARWESHALRARAYAGLGDWKRAVTEGRKAFAGVERLRSRVPMGAMRSSFADDRSAVYADLVIALLRAGRPGEALEVADAGRGRALLERMQSARTFGQRPGIGDLNESERLLRQIDWLVERLKGADTIHLRDRTPAIHSDMASLSARLLTSRRRYEELLQRAAVRDPRGAVMVGAARTQTRHVLGALRNNEALVEYFVTPRLLIVFVVTSGQVRALQLAVPATDLRARVRIARELGSSRASPPAARVSQRAALTALNGELIAPIERTGILKGVQRLIIVPHAALTGLPFAALVDSSDKYLIERYEIVTLPSSASLPMLRARAPSIGKGDLTVFAPFPERLPGTVAEARAVSDAMPRVIIQSARRANERAFRSALASRRAVHVASHGLVNNASPMFSRIEFASEASRTPGNDGLFEVHELLGLEISSDFVFLSGCETGGGSAWVSSFRVESDYATLSQAFLAAGASNVVSTLWRIDDEGAARFATHFYQGLEGGNLARALARAQRMMIKDSVYGAAGYWAGYILSGSGYAAL